MYRGIILAGLLMLLGQGCTLQEPEYIEVETDEAVFEDRFYYEQLDRDEQQIYREIYEGIVTQEDEFCIHGSEPEEANEILLSVMYDSPELFWVDGSAKATTREEEGMSEIYTIMEPNYIYSEKEIKSMQEEIDTVVNDVLAGVPSDCGEYDKIKYVYEYLIETAEYTIGAEHSQNMYSALVNGETVCAGYAKANQYLLNKMGIFCTYVMGTAVEEGRTDSHAWNIVCCDDKYYYVDITWADPLLEEGSEGVTTGITYDYLCCSGEELEETHTLQEGYDYPECISDDLDYYRMHDMYYEDAEYEKLLEEAYESIDNQEATTVYKFANKEVYEEAKNVVEQKLLNAAAQHLCEKYNLSKVNYQYSEDEKIHKIVIYWSYE